MTDPHEEFIARQWVDGEKVPASALNRIERGVQLAHERIDGGVMLETARQGARDALAASGMLVKAELVGDDLVLESANGERVSVGSVRGAPGADSQVPGPIGPATDLGIGTVTTSAPGAAASATIVGEAPDLTLNLTLPRGEAGPTGPVSTTPGPRGPQGDLTPVINRTISGAVTPWPAELAVPGTVRALLAGNVTSMPALPAGPAGWAGTITLELIQDAAGGFDVTGWPSNLRWSDDGPAPTLNIAPNGRTTIHCLWDGVGPNYQGSLQGRYSA